LNNEPFAAALKELCLIHYHEAGHVVADTLLGFKPKSIKLNLAEHDRRTTAFFRTNGRRLTTPHARERVQDYAVSCIAGIVAESKFSGVPLIVLKETAGVEDYQKVGVIADRLILHRASELTDGVRDAYIALWEARAVALIKQPVSWAIVESIVSQLQMSEDSSLNCQELAEAIQRGMQQVVSIA
jgi:hypothetical protein